MTVDFANTQKEITQIYTGNTFCKNIHMFAQLLWDGDLKSFKPSSRVLLQQRLHKGCGAAATSARERFEKYMIYCENGCVLIAICKSLGKIYQREER